MKIIVSRRSAVNMQISELVITFVLLKMYSE